MDKISVVIPSYNRADYVADAIQSVLAQEGVTLEVIVVDDGSSDDTDRVVQGFGDPVRYIRQENAGASAARNTGIRASTSPLVAFLDSDDLWLPGKLAQQAAELHAAEAVAHLTDVTIERPFADGVSLMELRGMTHLFDADKPLVLPRPLATNVQYNFARTQSILVRRDALDAAGHYDTRYRFFEDTDLMNRIALQGTWAISRKSFVREIRRDEAIEGLGEESRRKPHIGQTALVEQMQTLLTDPRLTEEERAVTRRYLGRYAYAAGKSLLRAGDTAQARSMLKTGWSQARAPRCLAGLALSWARRTG